METKTLLDIDYLIENNAPVIRLFYKITAPEKNEADKKVACVRNFTPYFYAVPKEDIETLEYEIKQQNLAVIIRTERVKKFYRNNEVVVLKIYTNLPYDIREIREVIRNLPACKETYEDNIPFTERYTIDTGTTFIESDKNLITGAFDIETYNPKIMSRPGIDPILAISYAEGRLGRSNDINNNDINNNNNTNNTTYKKVFTWKKSAQDFVETCESEADMLNKFLQTISERDIDILVSYNGDNYDFKYLQERAKILKFKMPLNFGKFDGVEKKLKFEKSGISVAAYIDGLPHIDLFPVARQLFSLPKYDLNNVYFEIFGKKGKEDLDKSKIYEIWDDAEKSELCKQNLNKFFKYSLKDSEITLEIALSLLPLYIELSHITGMPLQKTTRMGSGMRVEHLLMSKSYKKNLLIPNKRSISHNGEEESYAGGFVLEPEKGLHDNIIVFDFRSLYPSIIISHNIDPLTINCECCKNDEDNKISINNSTFRFCKKNTGFIPEVLKSLVERRIELKNLMKTEENLEKRKILDVQQQALKILVNSAYGYMGFARARWYSKECAESVTAYGRKYIQQVMDEARKVNFNVIYGDSLPYDRYIFIKFNNGDIMPVKIGELYDKYKDTDTNINGIFTLAMDKNKKITFKPIIRVIRHNYNGKLLRIITKYGSTIVTPQHAVYSFNHKTNKICLVDAKELKKGDPLISLTNPEITAKYMKEYIFDVVEMDMGEYSKELSLYSDNLSFPSKHGECPYCKQNVHLSSHVYLKHPERRQAYKKESSFAWVGGKNAKTRKIPRYWTLDKDLAWLLGFYCAEGSVSDVLTKSGRKCILSFGSQNKEILKKVKSILDTKTGTFTKIIEDYDKGLNKKMFYYRISSVPIVALFQYGFGAGKGSEFKKIPWFIFAAEEPLRKVFTEGYLDGDGNFKKGERYVTHFIEFSTKSKDLAIGLGFLFKTLKYGKNYFGKEIKHVAWHYRKDKPKIQKLRLQSAKGSKGDFCLAEITSIEEMPNEKYVYDLEVSNIHNFVDAEGMILVHNTDSIFMTKPGESRDEILSDANKFLKHINESLPGMMELDLQGFYQTGIFITKKRYALMEEDGRLIVKGLETKRRDWANIAKETQKEVLMLILKEKNVRKAVDLVRKKINEIKEGNVRKEELVINTKLTRSVDSYIQKKEPHVAAVKRAMNKGINFEEGDIITYIVTKNGREINEKTMVVELVEEGNYDVNYYIDNQILPAVMRIMEAMNYSKDELKGMEKQMKLF